MFDDYTNKQLFELRSLCADIVERSDEVEKRADALLVLQHIDEELAMRDQKKSA